MQLPLRWATDNRAALFSLTVSRMTRTPWLCPDTSAIYHGIQLAVAPAEVLAPAVSGMIGAVAGRLARIIDRARVVGRPRASTPNPNSLARAYKELGDLRFARTAGQRLHCSADVLCLPDRHDHHPAVPGRNHGLPVQPPRGGRVSGRRYCLLLALVCFLTGRCWRAFSTFTYLQQSGGKSQKSLPTWGPWVYSTGSPGRICPACRQPVAQCNCKQNKPPTHGRRHRARIAQTKGRAARRSPWSRALTGGRGRAGSSWTQTAQDRDVQRAAVKDSVIEVQRATVMERVMAALQKLEPQRSSARAAGSEAGQWTDKLQRLVSHRNAVQRHKGTLLPADLPGNYLHWFAREGFSKGRAGPVAGADARSITTVRPAAALCAGR